MADNTIYQDAVSRAKTFDITDPILPQHRVVHRDLLRLDDPDVVYQNATLAAIDEVQSMSAGDRTGGTFDVDFTLADGQTFSVNGLAWNVTATAFQTALDAAALLAITNYQAGDIVVTGGPAGSAGSATVFTFGGSSVRGNHPLAVVDGALLTGGTTDPVFSETTAGVVPRFWFAALRELGCITGTDPNFGVAPAGQYTVLARDTNAHYPSQATIEALVHEATVQEGQDWDSELLPLFGYKKLVEHLER